MTKVSNGKLIHIAIDVFFLVSSSTAALFKDAESGEKKKIISRKGTPKN